MNLPLIAVVGASSDPKKYGHRIFRDLLASDYPVAPVNPKGGVLLGVPVVASLRDLKKLPDLVLTVVPPEVTVKIVQECIKLGISKIWMQPGSESDAAIHQATQAGIDVTAHACFMKAHHLW